MESRRYSKAIPIPKNKLLIDSLDHSKTEKKMSLDERIDKFKAACRIRRFTIEEIKKASNEGELVTYVGFRTLGWRVSLKPC
jgi:hypothetical protein